MPKASINIYYLISRSDNYIRGSRKRTNMKSVSKTMRKKKFSNYHFRRSILWLDPRHIVATFFIRNIIHKNILLDNKNKYWKGSKNNRNWTQHLNTYKCKYNKYRYTYRYTYRLYTNIFIAWHLEIHMYTNIYINIKRSIKIG